MTYECQFQAIQALYPAVPTLRMRHPGNWYVSSGVEIKDGMMLRSAIGNGSSPVLAIRDLWDQLTNLKPNQYIVINAYHGNRRAVRWNGFMWCDVEEEIAKPNE